MIYAFFRYQNEGIMKQLIILTLLLGMSITGYSQSQKSILKAIGAGDLSQVTKYLADDVELCFFDDQNLYAKSEATTKLQNFFKKLTAQGINIKHEGDNKSGKSSYSIAELTTPEGPLRVFLYTAGTGADIEIQELRFTNP